jgi:myo-inositol-1(or 4)-monophosphatase
MLSNAVKAARRAGNIITRASEDIGSLKIQTKTYNDFVTEVDRAAEQAIIDTLKELYPTHGFFGEESGQSNIESDFVWIIDPLDGTTNFLHGLPQYCISIALQERGVFTTQTETIYSLPPKAAARF